MIFRSILMFILQCHLMGCNSGPIPRWMMKHPVREVNLRVDPTELPTELVLEFDYELDPQKPCEEGVIARMEYQNRMIRANLHPHSTQARVLLGKSPVQAERLQVRYLATEECGLKNLKAKISPDSQRVLADKQPLEEQLALQHSPFIAVRTNQIENPFTDIPLELAYSFIHHSDKNTDTLRYTAYFSDEDSIGSASGTDSQMAKYGRRTDIEWVYEVELDSNHRVLRRRYQGGYLFGIGHRTVSFEGQFLGNSDHPILYDIADHNVFSDSPSSGQSAVLDGYHFVPKTQIRSPEAREWVMFRNPWMFQVSDQELMREKKLSRPSTDYLYVLVDGELKSGSLESRIFYEDIGRKPTQANTTRGTQLDRLGEDLWRRQSFTAIPVGEANLAEIFKKAKHGVFDLVKKTSAQVKLKFFRLKKNAKAYQLDELTQHFQCKDFESKLTCLF